jgi:hypothetical protein
VLSSFQEGDGLGARAGLDLSEAGLARTLRPFAGENVVEEKAADSAAGEAGAEFRKQGWTQVEPGPCFSGCLVEDVRRGMRALACGVRRFVARPEDRAARPAWWKASLAAAVLVLAASDGPAAAQGAGFGPPSGAPLFPLRLSYDAFDTAPDLGRPVWLGLPEFPFLPGQQSADPSLALVFDPQPLGPPQHLRPTMLAQSPFDPEPLGPPALMRVETTAVASGTPAPPPEPPVTTGSIRPVLPPAEGSSGESDLESEVVLRRRY